MPFILHKTWITVNGIQNIICIFNPFRHNAQRPASMGNIHYPCGTQVPETSIRIIAHVVGLGSKEFFHGSISTFPSLCFAISYLISENTIQFAVKDFFPECLITSSMFRLGYPEVFYLSNYIVKIAPVGKLHPEYLQLIEPQRAHSTHQPEHFQIRFYPERCRFPRWFVVGRRHLKFQHLTQENFFLSF